MKVLRYPLLGFLLATSGPLPASDEELMEVTDSWQLFLDSEGVEETSKMSWRWHDPLDAGRVFSFDAGWEGPASNFVTMMGEEGHFRMYYRGWDGKGGDETAVTCLAESADGIHWSRPKLGLHEHDGTTANNILLADAGTATHNFAPFIDLKPGIAEEERYKAVGGLRHEGLEFYASPDGIAWTAMDLPRPFSDNWLDTQNVVFWSPREEAYVCYQREWLWVRGDQLRWVSRSTSLDLEEWSAPEEIDVETKRDWKHIYVNQIAPYPRAPEILLAFAGRFVAGRPPVGRKRVEQLELDPSHLDGVSDTILLVSRDGLNFEDGSPRVLIPPGPDAGNWAARSNFAARNVLMTGPREMSLYMVKRYGQPACCLHRYTIRKDGFVSAFAGRHGGQIVTKPFRLQGNTLRLNYACSAGGWAKVGVLSMDETPQDGFEVGDFRPLRGDAVDTRCEWKNGVSLGEKRGEVIRLVFDLREADLYGWRIDDEPMTAAGNP